MSFDRKALSLAFNESHQAFIKHLEKDITATTGQQLILISLVEELSKESVLSDAFFDHISNYNNPQVTYITFDFHEHWSVEYDI